MRGRRRAALGHVQLVRFGRARISFRPPGGRDKDETGEQVLVQRLGFKPCLASTSDACESDQRRRPRRHVVPK